MYILYAQYHTIQRTKFIISSLSPGYEAINFTCLVSSLMHILRLYLESKLHTENTWKHVKMTCKSLECMCVIMCACIYAWWFNYPPWASVWVWGCLYITLKAGVKLSGWLWPMGGHSSVVGAPAAKAVGPAWLQFPVAALFFFFFCLIQLVY